MTSRSTIIVDSHYFAPITSYLYLGSFSHAIIEQYDFFRKGCFRNRCRVMGSNGPINLTVPIIGGRNQRCIMKEIRIDHSENWRLRHWKTMQSAYNKSPWFDFFRDELEVLYLKKFEWLVDWNAACLRWSADKLSIETSLQWSESHVEYPATALTDYRNRVSPASIQKAFPEPPRYPQVFENRIGFIPDLSILDWLFCMGNRLP